MSDDSTDTILGSVTAAFLGFCAISVCVGAIRRMRQENGVSKMKTSPSMEQLNAADPTNNV
jgi:hypothetical protein